MPITLYELLGADNRRFSPFCWRIRMALAHKGLNPVYEACRFADKHRFAFANWDRVPVLKDGDRVVTDSWAIACYLDDAYPDRPSVFGGPAGKGLAMFFNEWLAALRTPMLRFVLMDIYDHLDPRDRAYFRSDREKRFGTTLEAIHAQRDRELPAIEAAFVPLRATLENQPYLCGDSPAYADYILFGTFQQIRSISPYRFIQPGDALYDWRSRMIGLYGGIGRSTNAYPE